MDSERPAGRRDALPAGDRRDSHGRHDPGGPDPAPAPPPPSGEARAAIDPDLVRRAQRGDATAMQQLLRALTPYVARWCGPIALQDGPDAAQETMIVVFRRLRQLKEPAALLGWVRTIALREAVSTATRARRSVPAELTDIPSREEMELVGDVRDVLSRLSPQHRAVLVLRDLEDLDERSVAAILDVSAGTVKSRLHRARRKFRASWN